MSQVRDSGAYQAIAEHYGTRTAARSGVPLINHIHEGLRILQALNADPIVQQAFCLHPLLQNDDDLRASLGSASIFRTTPLNAGAVVLAMEYRAVANAYLSHHCQGPDDRIGVGALLGVCQMLIADKVQNRKDFEIYHKDSHPNSVRLTTYFANWLRALSISEARYEELVAIATKGD